MIHPRRLKGAPTNIARYYTVGDYYTKGTDEHSEWGGALAADLGLSGKVDPAVFKELLAGKVAGQQLGRHRHEGGIVHETTGRVLVARFTEHASRELDPHLHTHAVVLNMTNREDGGPMASLETRAMYAEQMTAGQVYRNDLAHSVRELGYEIDSDPRSGLFEIRDVPGRLMHAFSQRAEQIDAYAKEHGLEGQAARRRAFYATRPTKERIGLDELRGSWADRSSAEQEKLGECATRLSAVTCP